MVCDIDFAGMFLSVILNRCSDRALDGFIYAIDNVEHAELIVQNNRENIGTHSLSKVSDRMRLDAGLTRFVTKHLADSLQTYKEAIW